MRRARLVNRRDQSGAIAIMAAVTLSALLLFTALAVDTGRLFLEKRSLQQQADLAALQAAQIYCSGYDSLASVEASIRSTLADHGFDPDDEDNSLSVGLGTVGSTSNRRSFSSASEFQAVQVQLTREIPSALFAGGLFNNTTLSATAVAERDLIATLSAGNSLLNVDSEQSDILDSVLGGLLGATLNLSVASYQGLAEGALTFGALVTELSAAGLLAAGDGLEDLSNLDLTLGELLSAVSDALTGSGGSSAAISAVDEMLNQAIAAGSNTEIIDLNTILSVDDDYAGSDQALESALTPLQFITSALMAGNVGESLNLDLAVNTSTIPLLEDLIDLTVTLDIQSAPTIAVGRFGYDSAGKPRTEAKAAVINLGLNTGLRIGLPGLATVTGDIAINATTADGAANLHQISQCPRLLSRQFDFSVRTSSDAANVDIEPIALTASLLLGLVKADVGVDIPDIGVGSQNNCDSVFEVDLSQPGALPTDDPTYQSSCDTVLLSNLISEDANLDEDQVTVVDVEVLGLILVPLGPLLDNLVDALLIQLIPIISGVAELALDPVLDALGLSLGEVRVQVLDVEEGRGELML